VLTAVVGEQVHIVLFAYDYDFGKEQASDFLEQAQKLGCEAWVLVIRGMSSSAVAGAPETGKLGNLRTKGL
jgi:hypothetical protein